MNQFGRVKNSFGRGGGSGIDPLTLKTNFIINVNVFSLLSENRSNR